MLPRQGLASCSALRKLDLSGNRVRSAGAARLGRGLPASLQELVLGRNTIAGDGAQVSRMNARPGRNAQDVLGTQ